MEANKRQTYQESLLMFVSLFDWAYEHYEKMLDDEVQILMKNVHLTVYSIDDLNIVMERRNSMNVND